MFRIEKEREACVTRLLLSGRIQLDCIRSIRSAMAGACARKILDLGEFTLVDLAVVRFLIRCEAEGVELTGCPPYIREWMLRELSEEALA